MVQSTSRRTVFRLVAEAAAVTLLTLGAAGARAAESETPGVTQTEVVFGETLAKSGPAGIYGQQAIGVEAYFRMVNDQGGVSGRKIRYINYDDKYQPSLALQLVRQLIEVDRIFAGVGISGTNQIKAALSLLVPAGVPVAGVGGGDTFVWKTFRPTVYNNWPWYEDEGALLASFMKDQLKLKKVGILYQVGEYGDTLLAGVARAGLTPAVKIGYDPTQADFSAQAARLKSEDVDGVLILANPTATTSLLNGMNAVNFKPVRVMSFVAASSYTFKSSPLFEGAYISAFVPPLEDMANPQVKEFATAIKKYFQGETPNEFSAWGWSYAQIAVAGLRGVQGPLTRQAYMDSLNRLKDFPTLGGAITYTPTDHTGVKKMFMLKIKDAKRVSLDN